MKKKDIPSITSIWGNLKTSERRDAVIKYFQEHYRKKTVLNKDTGLTIMISIKSGRKTAYGEAMYPKKAELIRILPELIEIAEYNNFGNRKPEDSKDILGYLNFKSKCYLDGKPEHVRIAVQFQKGGKFYYNIEVNKKIAIPT